MTAVYPPHKKKKEEEEKESLNILETDLTSQISLTPLTKPNVNRMY